MKLKIMYLIFAIIIIIIAIFYYLVRFENASIENNDIVIVGYNEKTGKFIFSKQREYSLSGIDGPYIINDSIYRITSMNTISREPLRDKHYIKVFANNIDNDTFSFNLQDSYQKPLSNYLASNKIIAISDIEGNFDGFSSFLKNNHVIDSNFNWIFGNNQLVLLGDFVDRGDKVSEVLWLIYKMDYESKKFGGVVHYILGNHEVMNLQGKAKYSHGKYKKAAQLISGKVMISDAVRHIYSTNSAIGAWLRSKNVIEQIGDYIFVHAGLSYEITNYGLTLENINEIARKNLDRYHTIKDDENLKIEDFIFSKRGPLWYRGLASDYKDYNKISKEQLSVILNHFKAKTIIFGHSIVEDIHFDYNRQLLDIDIKHGTSKNSSKTKGILIEDGVFYKIDGKAYKTKL
ncbi:MAG TPA: metallophosphoesterase [Candidatus Kapabacteria bacterium]|nr:metallophosphoesterase [Candidatus Kapabacteria bacterium]